MLLFWSVCLHTIQDNHPATKAQPAPTPLPCPCLLAVKGIIASQSWTIGLRVTCQMTISLSADTKANPKKETIANTRSKSYKADIFSASERQRASDFIYLEPFHEAGPWTMGNACKNSQMGGEVSSGHLPDNPKQDPSFQARSIPRVSCIIWAKGIRFPLCECQEVGVPSSCFSIHRAVSGKVIATWSGGKGTG